MPFFSPQIRGIILDMDGVLWKDTTPLVDIPAVFDRAQKNGIQIMLATNNATRTPAEYVKKLASFGCRVEENQIITAGIATAQIMSLRYPAGGPVYILGEPGLVEILEKKGFYASDKDVIAVVGGLDLHISYQKLKQATLLIRSGVPFYFTNPDRTYPTPEGQIPGAGTILAALQAATDVEPILAGKPSPTMYQIAIDRLGINPNETLGVGDRLETDIAGAQNAGCRSAVVLSGVTNLEQVRRWKPAPDLVARDLDEIVQIITS